MLYYVYFTTIYIFNKKGLLTEQECQRFPKWPKTEIITLCTLNIYNCLCQLYLNNARKNTSYSFYYTSFMFLWCSYTIFKFITNETTKISTVNSAGVYTESNPISSFQRPDIPDIATTKELSSSSIC